MKVAAVRGCKYRVRVYGAYNISDWAYHMCAAQLHNVYIYDSVAYLQAIAYSAQLSWLLLVNSIAK